MSDVDAKNGMMGHTVTGVTSTKGVSDADQDQEGSNRVPARQLGR